jgi:hypothetical protein
MTEWLLGKQALVVALTSFMLAITSFVVVSAKLIEAIRSLIRVFRPPKFEPPAGAVTVPGDMGREVTIMVKLRQNRQTIRLIGLLLVFVGVGILGGRYVIGQTLPPNARLTKEAWDAFNKGEWRTAIRKAEECIDRFQDQADDQQKQLETDHVTVPNGVVPKEEKEEILRRGPLNDVATCFFIKGQAAEKLGQNGEAKQAYEAAAKYTYARCFDPSWNGFWSPSEAANGRLKRLK